MYKECRGREDFLAEPCLCWGIYAVWHLGSSPAIVLLAYGLGLSAAQLLEVGSKHPITLCMWERWGRMSTWIHRTAREITITTPAVVVGDIFIRPSHIAAGLLQSTWCVCALRTVRAWRGVQLLPLSWTWGADLGIIRATGTEVRSSRRIGRVEQISR